MTASAPPARAMATSQPSEVGSDAAACRRGCGACCIAPSITSPLPKMPAGKPAGERCAHLTEAMDCELFGRPERPAVCGGLQPSQEMCGASREHAMVWLGQLEKLTAPAASLPRGTQAAMPPHR